MCQTKNKKVNNDGCNKSNCPPFRSHNFVKTSLLGGFSLFHWEIQWNVNFLGKDFKNSENINENTAKFSTNMPKINFKWKISRNRFLFKVGYSLQSCHLFPKIPVKTKMSVSVATRNVQNFNLSIVTYFVTTEIRKPLVLFFLEGGGDFHATL